MEDSELVEQQGMMADMLGLPAETTETETSNDLNFQSNLEEEQEGEQTEQTDEGEITEAAEQEQQAETQVSVEDELRATIAQLAGQLEALAAGTSQVQQIYPAPASTQQQAPADGQPTSQVASQTQQQVAQASGPYLTEDELDQIIDNPALILTAIQRAQQDVVQQVVSNLPNVVSQLVNQQVAVQSAVTEFYTVNEDLRKHADFVKFVMRDLETKHKDKTYSELFQMTADESRKRLGLQSKPAVQRPTQQQASTQQRPAFAGSKRTGTQRPAGKTEFFDPAAADMF